MAVLGIEWRTADGFEREAALVPDRTIRMVDRARVGLGGSIRRASRTKTPPSAPPTQNASAGSPAGRVGPLEGRPHPNSTAATTTTARMFATRCDVMADHSSSMSSTVIPRHVPLDGAKIAFGDSDVHATEADLHDLTCLAMVDDSVLHRDGIQRDRWPVLLRCHAVVRRSAAPHAGRIAPVHRNRIGYRRPGLMVGCSARDSSHLTTNRCPFRSDVRQFPARLRFPRYRGRTCAVAWDGARHPSSWRASASALVAKVRDIRNVRFLRTLTCVPRESERISQDASLPVALRSREWMGLDRTGRLDRASRQIPAKRLQRKAPPAPILPLDVRRTKTTEPQGRTPSVLRPARRAPALRQAEGRHGPSAGNSGMGSAAAITTRNPDSGPSQQTTWHLGDGRLRGCRSINGAGYRRVGVQRRPALRQLGFVAHRTFEESTSRNGCEKPRSPATR